MYYTVHTFASNIVSFTFTKMYLKILSEVSSFYKKKNKSKNNPCLIYSQTFFMPK